MDLVSNLDRPPNPLPIKHVTQAKPIRDLPWKFFLDEADREETLFPIGQDTAAGSHVFNHVRRENGAQHRRMRQRKEASNPWLLSFFGGALLLPSWPCDPLIFLFTWNNSNWVSIILQPQDPKLQVYHLTTAVQVKAIHLPGRSDPEVQTLKYKWLMSVPFLWVYIYLETHSAL